MKICSYSKPLFLLVLLLVLFQILRAQRTVKKYTGFTPGILWLDNNGEHINAHGGGFTYHNNTYYWFGEHKIGGKIGNTAQVGIHCYSSLVKTQN